MIELAPFALSETELCMRLPWRRDDTHIVATGRQDE